MSKLYKRRYEAVVGGLVFDGLDIDFEVVRHKRKEPNTCSITIYNLTESHRELLEGSKKDLVNLKVGYEAGELTSIFTGRIKETETTRSGASWTSVVRCLDGAQGQASKRVNRSYAKDTGLEDMIVDAAKVIAPSFVSGEKEQKLRSKVRTLAGNKKIAGAVVAKGPASQVLQRLSESAGLEWSIQEEQIVFSKIGQPDHSKSIVLSADSGLIDTPLRDRTKNIVTVRSLIVPGLVPGRQVRVESRFVTGDFRATDIVYRGSTRGNDWTAETTLQLIGDPIA